MQRSTDGYSSAWPPTNGTPTNGDAVIHTVDGADVERASLQAELAAAKERIVRARNRADAREAEAREALRAEIASTRDILAEIERQYREAVSMIQATARAEVERVLAEARQVAADDTVWAPSAEKLWAPDVA